MLGQQAQRPDGELNVFLWRVTAKITDDKGIPWLTAAPRIAAGKLLHIDAVSDGDDLLIGEGEAGHLRRLLRDGDDVIRVGSEQVLLGGQVKNLFPLLGLPISYCSEILFNNISQQMK